MSRPAIPRPSRAHVRSSVVLERDTGQSPARTLVPSRAPSMMAPAPPPPAPSPPPARIQTSRDVRTYLPGWLQRFTGLRPPGAKAPYPPLPFPPFTWLARLPLKYEIWITSLFGSFVSIALIELCMIGLASHDVIMIVASFGASAVLTYGTIESPLAQPRHLVGGQVVCAIVGVAVTRLFRHAAAYELHDITREGDAAHVVWLNGALSMALALLAMQVTGTVHPPGGATALIASVQPAAVYMSWKFVYVVLISSLVMLAWAMIINNVGRRRYPTYWLDGEKVYVRDKVEVTQDQLEMEAEEGRNGGFSAMERALSRESLRELHEKTRPGMIERQTQPFAL